ncbi:MAG: cell division protein FtsQ [Rhodospirillaceae bacterium]|nr:MAG: cell division protein FtsQ [Rhodospirillaceae bacterium]
MNKIMSSDELDTPKRKRVVPLWRRPQAIALGALVLMGLVLSGGTWMVKTGWGKQAVATVKWSAIKLSTEMGLTLQEVLVTGRSKTDRKALLQALGVVRGAPMLTYDFEEAKRRVEALPWIQYARLERQFPDTLAVHLAERQPIALWQNRGAFELIDEDGEVIFNAELEQYENLIHVVGEDAPDYVSGLLELLETQPLLKTKVIAAVRIGGRRWDLLMVGGINVRLPEDGAPAALSRLVTLETQSGIFGRDVKVLDLRLPDRVIVRRAPTAMRKPDLTPKGQET